jgi:hypothetical protein
MHSAGKENKINKMGLLARFNVMYEPGHLGEDALYQVCYFKTLCTVDSLKPNGNYMYQPP